MVNVIWQKRPHRRRTWLHHCPYRRAAGRCE